MDAMMACSVGEWHMLYLGMRLRDDPIENIF